MFYYNKTDISEGTNLAKNNNSKECMICHYWLFNHGFKFQDCVCNDCHALTILSVNISDIAIITIKNVDHQHEAINLLKKVVGIFKKYCLNF